MDDPALFYSVSYDTDYVTASSEGANARRMFNVISLNSVKIIIINNEMIIRFHTNGFLKMRFASNDLSQVTNYIGVLPIELCTNMLTGMIGKYARDIANADNARIFEILIVIHKRLTEIINAQPLTQESLDNLCYVSSAVKSAHN